MTETELKEMIASIDTQIEAFISKKSYSIGKHSVKNTEHLKELRNLREMYQKRLDSLPVEEVTIWRDY